jgi:ABC-type ATPase with predicted acetyltransferase domain
MKTLTFSRSFKTRVDPTPNVKACAAMFGLGVDEDLVISLYEDLPVRLGRGRVIFITGDSGAGKSCLLRDILSKASAMAEFQVIQIETVEGLPDAPLVDQFPDLGIREIGALLASVGISEAFVYLRSPRQLSDGQRYRFLLARMIWKARGVPADITPLIAIDEYLAFLDRDCARNVAYQTRAAATKAGLCFVLATTHNDIAKDLQANTTYTMRLSLPVDVEHNPLAGR